MSGVRELLVVPKGKTWAYGWAVRYEDAPIDDTWVVQAQARPSLESEEVLHEWTSPEGGAAVEVSGSGDDAVSAVIIALDPDDTRSAEWLTAVYSVEIHKAGVELEVSSGDMVLDGEVTR